MKTRPEKVRVLIADDSYLWSATLTEALEGDPDIAVVERAANGQEAVRAVERLLPSLVVMDIHMPVLGGLEAISVIMAHCPTPILVMTGDPAGRSGKLTFEALRRGALDLMVKETSYPPGAGFVEELRQKVKDLSRIRVVRHVDIERPEARAAPIVPAQRVRCVGIVASTGGPLALETILTRLPETFGAGVVVVQHLTEEFAPILASWLDEKCRLKVAVGGEGDLVRPGRVLIAPADRHLVVGSGGVVHLVEGPGSEKHCPSGNLLLSSLAGAYGATALGLVLTGMGSDGSLGLLEMRRAGAVTLAQDEATSTVFGMPRAAGAAGGVQLYLALDEIPGVLLGVVGVA